MNNDDIQCIVAATTANTQQDELQSCFGQILHGWALAMEAVAASHMNKKKNRIAWQQCTFKWDNMDGYSLVDQNHRAKLCAEAVAASREVSSGHDVFHYAGDKGYAGTSSHCSSAIAL